MNQEDLAKTLVHEHGLSEYFSNRIIKTILNTIVLELKKGNLVRLRNFGTFRARRSHRKMRAKFNDSNNIFKYYGQEE